MLVLAAGVDASTRNSPGEIVLSQARTSWRQQNYRDAAMSAQEYLKLKPEGVLRDEAVFIAGSSYYHLKRYRKAAALARRLISEGRSSKYWDDGVFLMARILGRTDHALRSTEYLLALTKSSSSGKLRANAADWLRWLVEEKLTPVELSYLEKTVDAGDLGCAILSRRLALAVRDGEKAEAIAITRRMHEDCRSREEVQPLLQRVGAYREALVDRYSQEADVFKIGFLCPLNGEASLYGEAMAHGAQLAVDDWNGEGKFRFELVVEDSRGDPVRSAAAARRLIREEHVGSIVGAVLSVSTIAAAASADALETPLLSPSAPRGNIGGIGDYVFVTTVGKRLEGITLADYVFKELGLESFVVLASDSPESRRFVEGFSSRMGILGGEILDKAFFPRGETDFTDELKLISQMDFQAMVIDGDQKELLSLLPQVDFFEIDAAVLGSSSLGAERIRREAASFAEGVVFTGNYYWLPPERIQPLARRFKERFKRDLDPFSLRAYLAVKMIASIVSDGAYTPGLIRSGLEEKLYRMPELARSKIVDLHSVGAQVPILTIEDGQKIYFE